MARYADAWNSDWQQSAADYAPLLARLDAACDAIGRERESLIKTGSVRLNIDQSAQEMINHVREVRELGLRHLVIGLEPRTTDAVKRFGEIIAMADAR